VTDEEIEQLTQLFLSLSLTDNGRVFQVRPQVVMEIAFDQILESTRHASGFALRFPRITRIRTDQPAEQADTLERVREIYASVGNLGKKAEPIAVPEPTLFDGLID
jgi:DNA ligase-1